MDCCDLLLGNPFQYDRYAIHDGLNNVYTLKKDGHTFYISSREASLPLVTPKQAKKLFNTTQ